jgi:hypothetical protein
MPFDLDLVALLMRAPAWVRIVISIGAMLWGAATALSAALRQVPEARYVALETAWPWAGHLARAARKFGTDVQPFLRELGRAFVAAFVAGRAPGDRPTPPAPPRGQDGFAKLHALFALAVAVALCVALGALAGGCAPRPWQDSAHIALNATAHGVALSDELVAGAIARDARDPARTSDQLEATWRPAITAMGSLRAALVAAQGAVDAAAATHAAGDRCHALALVARARALAEDLATALRAAGLAVPDEVPRAIRLAGDLAASLSPRCTEVPDAG